MMVYKVVVLKDNQKVEMTDNEMVVTRVGLRELQTDALLVDLWAL